MVCMLDNSEGMVQASIEDSIGSSKSRKISLCANKKVNTLFTEIEYLYQYEHGDIDLFLRSSKNPDPVVLKDHMDKTLSEAGVIFDNVDDISISIKKQSRIIFDLCEQNEFHKDYFIPKVSNHRKRIVLKQWNNFENYVGLVNQAMTCYLNSLLQALYMTPEFRNALYNWEFDGNNPSKSIPFQLQRLFLNLQTSKKSAVETTDLTHSFGWNMQQAWEQHDIQELCRVMFDALEQKFKDTKQANLINDLYEGKMLDYVKCLDCGTEKSREDTFQDIPLPVRPFHSAVAYNSVEEALRAFVQPERLEGNNQYFCEKCNKKCDADKGLKFLKFPYLLTLHLKRFDFDYSTLHRIKLNDKVVFPEQLNLNSFMPSENGTAIPNDIMEERERNVETVKYDDCSTTDSGSALDDESCQGTDISSNVTGPDENCQDDDEGIDVSSGNNHHDNEKNRLQEPQGPYYYDLFSIMIHSGSASGGHYYAYIKDFSTNQWFCFNDQSVTPVTEEDIHKTYGGGPQRGYYSGVYSSSTNAYMLMYRQIDKERNCEALNVENFPPHIQKLLQDMRAKEENDRLMKEKESDFVKVHVYCKHPVTGIMTDEKLFLFAEDECTLAHAKKEAYEKFKLKDVVNIEDCRLVVYNDTRKAVECSYEDDTHFDVISSKHYLHFLMEFKKPGTEFEKYDIDGVNMRMYFVDMKTEEFDGPHQIWINPGETLGSLKNRISKYKLDNIHIVQETYSNPPQYLESNDAYIKFEPKCDGIKLYVANALDLDDPNKSYPNSKLAAVIDRFVNVIMLDVFLPEFDSDDLDKLAIPTLDMNQNLERRIEIGAGDRTSNSSSLRVSPLVPICEYFEQSNSEDSSLSDSDRTLVGDAPGDNLGLLSSSSNSPADQHMASPIDTNAFEDLPLYDCSSKHERMNWDDTDDDTQYNTPEKLDSNYYFRAQLQPTTSATSTTTNTSTSSLTTTIIASNSTSISTSTGEDEANTKLLKVYVDKRTTLAKLKKDLETFVGVPSKYFKIFRRYPYSVECTQLSETLGSYKDGDKLIVKLGRVLRNNELCLKVYLFQPCNVNPATYWFDWIVTTSQTVATIKRDILLQAKKLECADIPATNSFRLRKKCVRLRPGVVYVDDDVFTSNCDCYVQETFGPEKTNCDEMVYFIRQWNPSSLNFGNYQEVCLSDQTLEELKKAVAVASDIPIENLEVAYVKQEFPLEMNVLEIHNNLNWMSNSDCVNHLDQVEGSVFYYRDNREPLKELTTEEKNELNQSENKRLGRINAKTYSPRREVGLKIYVDTSPKKDDKISLD